ncbi:MAG: FHA domain-containing protein [Clostridiaceae bacterium]|nr:FHA domain-containing protein [Clostridiaceae bacterium]
MKFFFDFILSNKVYMLITLVILLLIATLFVLIFKLAKETSKSNNRNKLPIYNSSKENDSVQQPKVDSYKSEPAEIKHVSEDIKTESIAHVKEVINPVIQEIPILKDEVKEEIVENIRANNKVNETQTLKVEVPKPEVEATQLLAKPKPKSLAILTYTVGEEIKEYSIINNITNLGRDPEVCDMVILGNDHIGRKHVLIYFKSNKFYLTDLNSKNGTYINGDRLQGERQISDGDVIRLATTEIKFKVC